VAKEAEKLETGKCNHGGVCKHCFLPVAAEGADVDCVNILIAAGADPNGEWRGRHPDFGPFAHSPLHMAVRFDRRFTNETQAIAVIEALIAAGADIEGRNYYRQTPLHLAVVTGHAAIVECLLVHGANPNTTDAVGDSPLHSLAVSDISACIENCARMAELLLKNGASTIVANAKGQTPIDCAKNKKRRRLVHALRGRGSLWSGIVRILRRRSRKLGEVPDGTYDVKVLEVRLSKSPEGVWILLYDFEILAGPHSGRRFTQNQCTWVSS
jgi:hypothetical protein